MKRWSAGLSEFVENSIVDAFLKDVVEISKRYGLSLSHEDSQGGFIIEEYIDANIEWLLSAAIGKSVGSTVGKIG